jgi:branched-chain amino acid transport system substrate-binding protein
MRLLFAAFASILLAAPARAAEPYDIHVIIPLTGGGSFIGAAIAANFRVVEEIASKSGGIGGRPVRFVFHDDQTKPQIDVQLATEIIAEKPAVIIGSAIVAECNAMAPLAANGPVLYCLSPSFAPAPGGYSFSGGTSTPDQIAAIVRYFRFKGWTKIGVLNGIDTTGQHADADVGKILALPENQGVTLVEHQHFNPSDLSVSAQIERIKQAGAQAMIAWTTGAPVATVFKGMVQEGLDIPVGTSSGNQTYAQMEQYAAFLPKRMLIGSALFPAHDGMIRLDPRVEDAQHEMNESLAAHSLKPEIATGVAWDPAMIVISGLRKLGPDATADALRDYIRGLTDFAGIDGIYDFQKYPDRGLGPDSAVVVTYDGAAKAWKWLSLPGGALSP